MQRTPTYGHFYFRRDTGNSSPEIGLVWDELLHKYKNDVLLESKWEKRTEKVQVSLLPKGAQDVIGILDLSLKAVQPELERALPIKSLYFSNTPEPTDRFVPDIAAAIRKYRKRLTSK